MTLEATATRPGAFSNRETADRRAGRFAVDVFRKNPEKAQDPKMVDLLDSLTSGASWRVLAILDGPADGALESDFLHVYTDSDYDKKREEARDWTAQNFNPNNLAELFEITKKLAINPSIFYTPGDKRGYSTLLAHTVDKKGSIFADKVSPEDRKRFVNGAFWEELGYGSALSSLENVLLEHASELDPAFLSDGIKLYERNKGMGGHEANMNNFSTLALDSYFDFVKRVSDQKVELSVPDETVDLLLRPYILAVISPDFDDPMVLRFGPQYDSATEQEIIPVNSYIVRLQEPLVRESLGRSEENRNAVSDYLPTGEASWLALDVVEAIGGDAGEAILKKYIEGFGKEDGERMRKLVAGELVARETDFSRRVLQSLFPEGK